MTASSDEEELFRHVAPHNFDSGVGRPSFKAFRPRTSDQGLLSVNRSTLTSAHDSHVLFTTAKPNGFSGTSEGDWAVTVAEVLSCALTWRDDPILANLVGQTPANPAHAVVDFTLVADPSDVARRLHNFAVTRGRRYP